MTITQNDIRILAYLFETGSNNQMKACTKKRLIKNTKFSESKIRASMKLFIKESYVKEGFMIRSAKTYYITQEGIEFFKNLEGERLDD